MKFCQLSVLIFAIPISSIVCYKLEKTTTTNSSNLVGQNSTRNSTELPKTKSKSDLHDSDYYYDKIVEKRKGHYNMEDYEDPYEFYHFVHGLPGGQPYGPPQEMTNDQKKSVKNKNKRNKKKIKIKGHIVHDENEDENENYEENKNNYEGNEPEPEPPAGEYLSSDGHGQKIIVPIFTPILDGGPGFSPGQGPGPNPNFQNFGQNQGQGQSKGQDSQDKNDETAVATNRGCPACVSGECNGNVHLSGLPIIQIIVALAAGFILAKIFIWIYRNFADGKEESSTTTTYTSYGPPSYGPPPSSYGLPAPSSSYSQRIGYPLQDINQLTDNVYSSIDQYGQTSDQTNPSAPQTSY